MKNSIARTEVIRAVETIASEIQSQVLRGRCDPGEVASYAKTLDRCAQILERVEED